MNDKTRQAIIRHGQALLAAFPNATELDPLALCKKLRRIEHSAAQIGLRLSNGPEWAYDEADKAKDAIRTRLWKLLNWTSEQAQHFFVNCDPRGLALKMEDDWTRSHNAQLRASDTPEFQLQTDWGGYGLIAPDLTNED